MYVTVTFDGRGKVSVYASYDGTSVNVTTEANNLRRMLPGAVYDAVMERIAGLLDAQGMSQQRIA